MKNEEKSITKNLVEKIAKWASSNVVAIALALALAIGLRVVLHVPFGKALGVIVFFWLAGEAVAAGNKAKKNDHDPKSGLRFLGNFARLAAVVYIIVCIFQVNAPRTYESIKIAMGLGDQSGAHGMGNNTNREAVDLWEATRSIASQKFLDYYQGLLWRGKTKEAADTLAAFNKHWDVDLLKDKKNEDEASKQSPSSKTKTNQQITIAPAPSGSTQTSVGSNTETHTFTKAGEAWIPQHYFSKGEEVVYTIENANVAVNVEGGEKILAPNKYGGPIIKEGAVTFTSQSPNAKVTITY